MKNIIPDKKVLALRKNWGIQLRLLVKISIIRTRARDISYLSMKIRTLKGRIMLKQCVSRALIIMVIVTYCGVLLSAPDTRTEDSSWLGRASEVIRNLEYNASFQKQSMIPGDEPAWHFASRAHDLRLYFHPDVTKIISRTDQKQQWMLSLGKSVFSEKSSSEDPPPVSAHENIIVRKGVDITESYINNEDGIHHTLRIDKVCLDKRPLIRIKMETTENLKPIFSGNAIRFCKENMPVLTYGCLRATDANNQAIQADLTLDEGQIQIAFQNEAIQYPVSISIEICGPSTAPGTTLSLGQNFSGFGWSVATAGDANGDGYSEVIIGAPYFDNGQADEGAAFVYRGTRDGLELIPVWKREGEAPGARMGWSVATAGDVNGDGFWDVIISAPYADNIFGAKAVGRVEVFHGSAQGLEESAAWAQGGGMENQRFGWCVAGAGDVNGDGYSEVIIGVPYHSDERNEEGIVYVYKGSEGGVVDGEPFWRVSPANQMYSHFGYSVACAGDVNADGYDDVIIGSPLYSGSFPMEGGVWVYDGGPEGLSSLSIWSMNSGEEDARFGYSVASAGDVNGDGHSDIIIGAPRHKSGLPWQAGRAYLFPGNNQGVSSVSSWEGSSYTYENDSHFGSSVAGAGDVNGDGYGDIIIGIPDDGTTEKPGVGRALIYYGSSLGPETDSDWGAGPFELSPESNSFYGYSVACAGDINGDGYSDVIVGAPYEPETGSVQIVEQGYTYVYYGAPDQPADTAQLICQSDQAGAGLGISLASAGDVNGDGYDDFLVAAPYFDNGHTDEGRVYLWHGSAGGLAETPNWFAEGEEVEANLGWSIASAGDVNGDGYDDIIIGCPKSNPLYISAGRVYVWHGSSTGMGENGVPANADWQTFGLVQNALAGYSVACAGDVNGDGFCDVIIGVPGENTARLFQGSPDGLNATPDWQYTEAKSGSFFGWSVASAGDVNRDGYFDVVIGAPFHAPTDNPDDIQKGLARAFYGSAFGLRQQAEWMAFGIAKNYRFGYSVSSGGDMDGDGFSEIVVGSPGGARVDIYHGGPNGPVSLKPGDAVYNVYGVTTSFLGFSVACAGDIDGDGRSDVIVGAPYDDAGSPDGRKGMATLIFDYSKTTGFATKVYCGAADETYLGWCVGGAGDVNGDGYADFLMGAPGFSSGQAGEGAAFFHYGNGQRGVPVLPLQWKQEGFVPIAQLCASDNDTHFWLSLNARAPFGRSKVRMELEVRHINQIFNGQDLFQTGQWLDTGTHGNKILQGLTVESGRIPYHWRGRIIYKKGNLFGLVHSRWVTKPRNGWNEMDFRTWPPDLIPGVGFCLY